jgi:phosphatidylinositol glycan class Q protein
LVANDILLGISLGSFISANAEALSSFFIHFHTKYAILSLRAMVVWLMGYPAGLKLNSELGKILGELFLWLIQIWTSLYLASHQK